MSKAKYRTLCSVQRDETTYPAGSPIALPEDTAARLLAMDPPAIEVIEDAAPTESTREPAQRLNAKDTIKQVKLVPTIEALQLIEAAELSHADGARSSVIEAIAARMAALVNGDAGDADDEDDEDDVDTGEGAEDA